MMDSAKVFMTGRSQAVRLPKAYRFDADEVIIERQPDGALLLRPKPRRPLGERLRAILQELPDDLAFERPEQPRLERDAAWWTAHGFGTARR
ncbi:MAG: antitoxin, partial [Terriglobales bacterium]